MEEQNFPKYEEARGIRYSGELRTIRKKQDSRLQFLYEAFMNSWEAIKERFSHEYINMGSISIKLFLRNTLLSGQDNIFDFDKFLVEDNGIGLDETNYNRLITLRDESKQMSNKGTGRIQFIHFFDETKIQSTYKNRQGIFRDIEVTLSKKEPFLSKNSIIRLDKEKDSVRTNSYTTVTFFNPLDENDLNYYKYLNAENIQNSLIRHFLALFCENRNNLPKIKIQTFHENNICEDIDISSDDILQPDKEGSFDIAYSKINENNKLVRSDSFETFQLKAFKTSSDQIKKNGIYLVSKGATGKSIDLYSLKKDDEIDGMKYMFLLSGEYLDEIDRDDRGNLNLIDKDEFKKQNENNFFKEEVILFDDIKDETNSKINSIYEELESRNQEKNKNIDALKEMFLLNSKTVDSIRKKIRNTDSDEKILKTIYEADSEIEAIKDNKIKEQINDLQSLTPDKTEDYQKQLQTKVDELVTLIPMQNRIALSKYVARRKLVLDLFSQILNKELESIKNKEKERIDEKLLHNLIFQQSSENDNPDNSDLWLINEEYLYFKGFSEHKLDDIKIGEDYLFKRESELGEDEIEYKQKNHKDAGDRRPDILLFPKEGKCIIVEFKAPNVDVSNHLNQINKYASLINNLSNDNLKINTFYGYLIGENINGDEIIDSDSDFISADKLDFVYRPYKRIVGKFGRKDGSLYTEVIRYSVLLDRAKHRNQIFIDKLVDSKNNYI